MQIEKERVIAYSFWIVLALGVCLYFGNQYLDGKRAQAQTAQQAEAFDKKLQDFKNTDGAANDWDNNFKFSYQIQDALSNADQAFYFKADLWDIYEASNQYHAVFDYSTSASSNLVLDLAIDPSYLPLLSANPTGDYALTANIASLNESRLSLSGSDQADGSVDLNGFPSDTLMATGNLQKILFLDNQ